MSKNLLIKNINILLNKFTHVVSISNESELKLINYDSNMYKMIFNLDILGKLNKDPRDKKSFDYLLSDGDKSAISLSSFLAKIYMLDDLNNKTIIIDDPFTSFDSERRNTTILELSKLAKKVKQLFIFTHSQEFLINLYNQIDLKDKDNNIITYQLYPSIKFVNFVPFDIEKNNPNNIQIIKDVNKLTKFLNGKEQFNDLSDVAGTTRKVLEGIMKIKFFDHNVSDETLGGFIKRIQQSNEEKNGFERLKPMIENLKYINNYSKIFHHGSANQYDVDINELINVVNTTMKLFREI